MKKLMLITLILIVVISMPTTVSAAYLDLYWTGEDPMPPDALLDPSPNEFAGWDWPDVYSYAGNVLDGDTIPDTTIGGGKFRVFALENLWLGEEWIKTVTLEFDYVGGDPQLSGTGFGYHPLNYVGGSSGTPVETDDGGHYKLVFTIDPQPDWEWFAIRNAGQANLNTEQANVMTITNFSLSSVCVVPEPATLSLFGLGGLALRRRRRAC